jgi:hypothetical protein
LIFSPRSTLVENAPMTEKICVEIVGRSENFSFIPVFVLSALILLTLIFAMNVNELGRLANQMNILNLRSELQDHLDRFQQMQFDIRRLVFAPQATQEDIVFLEQALGFSLPFSFRKILSTVSSHVEFRWFAKSDLNFPAPFTENFYGNLHWSDKFTIHLNKIKADLIDKYFPDQSDPNHAIWHNKLAFYKVGNGDMIAIDLNKETYEQIVYLSSEGGAGHGYVMAENFEQLLARWVPLACTGGEDWQWLPFCTSRTSFIDPNGVNAIEWRKLIGAIS